MRFAVVGLIVGGVHSPSARAPSQLVAYPYGGCPALDGQLFVAPQLAALAMDPKFLLGS